MTSLIRLDPSLRWPYSLAQLRTDEPQLSLSADPHDGELAALAELGILVARVQPTPRPGDTREQRAEESFPEQDGATWRQAWTLRDATADEIAAWDAAHVPPPDWATFRGALLISDAVAGVMAAARLAGCEPGVTALPVALEKAAIGDVSEFAACWALVAAAGNASAEMLAELASLATSCSLPTEFIAALQTTASPNGNTTA